MSKCRKYRTMFVEKLYGELSSENEKLFEIHLQECSKCANEFKNFSHTIHLMDLKQTEEPGAHFWDGYWYRLSERLRAEDVEHSARREGRRRVFDSIRFPRWAYSVAIATAFLVIGFFTGRLYFQKSVMVKESSQISSAPATNASLVKRTNRYLERSKIVLLGFVNFESGKEDIYGLNFPQQRQLSQHLISEATYLKKNLRSPRQKRLRELISDLEVILLQIANLEIEEDNSAIELIQSSIEYNGVLLKINLEEMKQINEKGTFDEKKGI